MKITPKSRFRDGRTTYEPGTEYDVPNAEGVYFVRSGWATSPDYKQPGTVAAAEVDVKPAGVKHAAKTKEG